MLPARTPASNPSLHRCQAPPWDPTSLPWQLLDQDLPADHLARLIDQAVDRLDLTDLLAAYAGRGSLPHPPALLLKAVLYEIQSGRRRPAQWCRDAAESRPLRWLLRGCRPSRTAWYAFRDRIHDLDSLWNSQVLHQALAAGLTPAQRLAIDGTLVAAQASPHRLINEKTLHRRQAELHQACAADQQGQPPAVVPGWMAATPRGRGLQEGRYQQAAHHMKQRQGRNARKRKGKRKARDKIVLNPSEPEAALGRDKQHVYRPLYNLQLASDLDSPLVLGYQVLAQPNDAGALGPLLERVRQAVGPRVQVALADASYAGGADLAAAEAAGVTVYAPWQSNDYSAAGGKKKKQIPKEQFVWLAAEQTYQCPQGHRLEFEGQSAQKRSGTEKVVLTHYRCPPQYCRRCPLRGDCTSNPEAGRTISRGEHEDLIEALRQRMATEEAKALYRLRRQTVELRYADAKQHRQLRHFSGRGLQRAETEAGLTVLAHNLVTLDRLRRAAANPVSVPA